MAADASAGRFRLAAPATASILGIAAAGLTVTMFAFATRLQDAVDLGTVRDELASAVHAAFEPAHLSIWIKEL